MSTDALHTTLVAPPKPARIPFSAKWLGGEGAGSWFVLESLDDEFVITRYSPEGNVECKGFFNFSEPGTFNVDEEYAITYLSHCQEVNVIQKGKKIKFEFLRKYLRNSCFTYY